MSGQAVPALGRPADLEGADDVTVVTARAEIVAGRPAVGGGEEPLVIEVDRFGHGVVEGVALLAFGRDRRVLGDGDAGPVGQAADGLDEIEVLDVADETDGIA